MSLKVQIKKKLKGFTLDVAFETDLECMGILGASGCGKSMTLKCIAGIEKPDSGHIELNGRVLFDSEKNINLSPQKRQVGYLFQNYALFPNMTVSENIAVGLPKGEARERVGELIALFQLEGLEQRYPWQLSGGQQQRAALARSLAYKPEVLMLDEPFSALDEYLKENLQMQVKEILGHYQGDILMVTHSRDEVYRFCPHIAVVHEGHVVAMGDTREIFQDPRHVTAAKLSGCKNLSRAEKRGDYRIYARDWEVELTTAQPVEDGIRYVGIRAHDLVPQYDLVENAVSRVDENSAPYFADDFNTEGKTVPSSRERTGRKAENQIPCRNPELPEGLFEQVVLFQAGSQAEAVLWWKVSREQWCGKLQRKLPQTFYLPPEALMLLRED